MYCSFPEEDEDEDGDEAGEDEGPSTSTPSRSVPLPLPTPSTPGRNSSTVRHPIELPGEINDVAPDDLDIIDVGSFEDGLRLHLEGNGAGGPPGGNRSGRSNRMGLRRQNAEPSWRHERSRMGNWSWSRSPSALVPSSESDSETEPFFGAENWSRAAGIGRPPLPPSAAASIGYESVQDYLNQSGANSTAATRRNSDGRWRAAMRERLDWRAAMRRDAERERRRLRRERDAATRRRRYMEMGYNMLDYGEANLGDGLEMSSRSPSPGRSASNAPVTESPLVHDSSSGVARGRSPSPARRARLRLGGARSLPRAALDSSPLLDRSHSPLLPSPPASPNSAGSTPRTSPPLPPLQPLPSLQQTLNSNLVLGDGAADGELPPLRELIWRRLRRRNAQLNLLDDEIGAETGAAPPPTTGSVDRDRARHREMLSWMVDQLSIDQARVQLQPHTGHTPSPVAPPPTASGSAASTPPRNGQGSSDNSMSTPVLRLSRDSLPQLHRLQAPTRSENQEAAGRGQRTIPFYESGSYICYCGYTIHKTRNNFCVY